MEFSSANVTNPLKEAAADPTWVTVNKSNKTMHALIKNKKKKCLKSLGDRKAPSWTLKNSDLVKSSTAKFFKIFFLMD